MHQTYCCKTHSHRHRVALMIYGASAVKIDMFQGHLVQCQCTHLIPLSLIPLSPSFTILLSCHPSVQHPTSPVFFPFQFCLPVSFSILLSSLFSSIPAHSSTNALHLLINCVFLCILLSEPSVSRPPNPSPQPLVVCSICVLVLSIVCC